MSLKIYRRKLPSHLTPELLTLIDSLHAAYERLTHCGCRIRIGTECDTFHHRPSKSIYLGTDVIQMYMDRCQCRMDESAAVMITYVLGHEYGHAIFERPNAEDRWIMALYFMGDLTLRGQKRMTRDTHRFLNVPIPAEMIDYLSGQPEAVVKDYRSYLRLLPKELREPNLTNLSAGEFLAEMNAAILLQALDLKWDHPLCIRVVAAVQEADWHRQVVSRHGRPMRNLVSFLRWNIGLQQEPAALREFLTLFSPEDIDRMLPKDRLDSCQPKGCGKLMVEFR